MSDLDDFLHEAHDQGALDSSGHFTLAYQQASRKLAQYQSAEPGFLILKLVQAAVTAGCRELVLSRGHHHVLVTAYGGEWDDLDWQALAQDPVRAQLAPEHTALRHLAIALAASLALEPRWVDCRYRAAQTRGLRLEAVAEGYQPRLREEERPGHPPRLEVELQFAESIEESRWCQPEAWSRCHHAPLPISLQGGWWGLLGSTSVNLQWEASGDVLAELHLGVNEPCRRGLLLASRQKAWYDCSPSPRHDFSARLALRREGGTPVERVPFKVPHSKGDFTTIQVPVVKTVILVLRSHSRSQLVFVKAGLSLDPIPVDWDLPACRVFSSGWHLPVDLSELKLVQGPELEAACQALEVQVREALREAGRWLEGQESAWYWSRFKSMAGLVAGGAAALTALGGMYPLTLAMGGIGATFWYDGYNTREFALRVDYLKQTLSNLK